MPSFRVRARPARGAPGVLPPVATDPDILASVLEDAAHYAGGHAAGVVFPRTEAEVAGLLRQYARVLPIGAQSSVTGGATPMGEIVISTAKLNRIVDVSASCARVEAGVSLAALQQELAGRGAWYPPAPTYNGAFVGGTVATNAAGAATFKYGATRQWVRALTVVLASGEVLEIRRGETFAHRDGYFEIEGAAGVIKVPVPQYRMPDVPKRSAGYHAEPGMDLIDLFIGSEGTLGIIVEVTLEIVPRMRPACWAFVPFTDERLGLEMVATLRQASEATWRSKAPEGLDVSAIEHMDRRSLALIREDGLERKCGVVFPPDPAMAILVQLELPSDMGAERAYDEIGLAAAESAPDTPLVRFCRFLKDAGVLSMVEIAVPGDPRRAEQLFALREAVPAAVNHRIGLAKQAVDPSIEKTAADMIVPFSRFAEMMAVYREGFERRGLDYAVWGHISDGNVHPNVIPRSVREMHAGREAILEFGREVARLGGCPLAEHGVGRSPVKQALLLQLYGDEGIDEMRAVKRALDPSWKLAPGVLFPVG